jgi:hypothetical protein
MKYMHITCFKGLLNKTENSPELSHNHMIPHSQVNIFFHKSVWTVTFKYLGFKPITKRILLGRILKRTKHFELTKNMLQ